MRIELSRNVVVSSDGFTFKLNYFDLEFYFKTFDLLLLKLVNLDLSVRELDSAERILIEIRSLKGMIRELFNEYGREINDLTGSQIGTMNNFANSGE